MRHDIAGYLFAYFTGREAPASERNADNEQVHYAFSRDGMTWRDLNARDSPVLRSNLGEHGVRDPFLLRRPEGGYVLLGTDLSAFTRHTEHVSEVTRPETHGSTSIVVAESDDLISWRMRLADVAGAIPGALMAWAPEAVWDEQAGHYMVFWTTASPQCNAHGSPYNAYYATTHDFVHFSEPVRWVDRETMTLDATMHRIDDRWVRITAPGLIETSRNPYAISAEAPTNESDDSHWRLVGTLQKLAGCTDRCEAPEIFPLPDGGWAVMVDWLHPDPGYHMFHTADPASPNPRDWSPAQRTNMGKARKRHGSVLPLNQAETDRLLDAFPVR